MADIFFSYAREDELRIRPLVDAFEAQGWSVFWDRRIPAGETWRGYIGAALQKARCVVVAWSASAIESEWVAEEADEGRSRKVLVPVLLDRVLPPRGFREIQAADLSDWRPGQASERFDELMVDLRRLLSQAPGPAAAAPAPPPASRPSPPPPAAQKAVRRGAVIGVAGALVLALAGYAGFKALRVDNDAGRTKPQPALPPASEKGGWLVVAGSFARGETLAAERRLKLLGGAGIDASVSASDDYPLLTPNLLLVVVGPFETRDAAEAALARVRGRVPDAYVKKGR